MSEEEWQPFGEAQGTVSAPKGIEIHLRMSEAGSKDLATLAQLQPEDLQSLWLPHLEVTEENLGHLARFGTLQEIYIDAATTAADRAKIKEVLPFTAIDAKPPAAVAETEAQAPPAARTVSFPADRTLGRVFVRDWTPAGTADWQELAAARGGVAVPEGKEAKLEVDYESAEDISALASLRPDDLQSLGLTGPNVTDETMGHVGAMTGLRGLNLLHTAITDVGMEKLANLRELREVQLTNINAGDSGFKVFQNLPRLRRLVINQANISNESLPLLRSLVSLRQLHLQGTKISREALVSLRFDMPYCEITPLEGQ
ncbi:MAG: hypothetical protein HYV26_16910 [Candidatus Hydrogenedentes bacterium]|nr:hypothetical protein [Candidatus Hydrogenedentota bacterium]